jgi:hypothetical protein
MLNQVRDGPAGKGRGARARLVRSFTVGKNARHRSHFRDPAAILFLLYIDRQHDYPLRD